MFCLEGKTALVTGGARDIGGACAIELARAGADVCINYNASEKDAEVVSPKNNEHAFALLGHIRAIFVARKHLIFITNRSTWHDQETCNIIRSFGRKAYSVQANVSVGTR